MGSKKREGQRDRERDREKEKSFKKCTNSSKTDTPEKLCQTTPSSNTQTLCCIQICVFWNFSLVQLLLSLRNILKSSARHDRGVLPWPAISVVSFCVRRLHNKIPHGTGSRQSLNCPSYLATPSVFPPKSAGLCLTQLKEGVYCVAAGDINTIVFQMFSLSQNLRRTNPGQGLHPGWMSFPK